MKHNLCKSLPNFPNDRLFDQNHTLWCTIINLQKNLQVWSKSCAINVRFYGLCFCCVLLHSVGCTLGQDYHTLFRKKDFSKIWPFWFNFGQNRKNDKYKIIQISGKLYYHLAPVCLVTLVRLRFKAIFFSV